MTTTTDVNLLRERAQALKLHGLVANWDEFAQAPWLMRLLEIEEVERKRRSLERRLRAATLGRFKPMADFDYDWPKGLDRLALDDLFSLDFLKEPANVVLIGPNGVGKSMIAQNLIWQAIRNGHTARFTTASALLNELAAQTSASALQRKFRAYTKPALLAIDEVGYLSYDTRHADLLFEVVSRRYGTGSIIITTNKPFSQWNEVFPNATCVVTLIDRLLHRAEILTLEGQSYRLKEATERMESKKLARRRKRSNKASKKAHPGADS